ncbi:MAG: hypothetical protein Q6363_007920 [Candidatus Njordarchaeota archaeon]
MSEIIYEEHGEIKRWYISFSSAVDFYEKYLKQRGGLKIPIEKLMKLKSFVENLGYDVSIIGEKYKDRAKIEIIGHPKNILNFPELMSMKIEILKDKIYFNGFISMTLEELQTLIQIVRELQEEIQ